MRERDGYLGVRVTQEEREEIEALARKYNATLSDTIRWLMNGKQGEPPSRATLTRTVSVALKNGEQEKLVELANLKGISITKAVRELLRNAIND